MSFDPFEAAIQALPPEELNSLGEQIDAQIAQLRSQRDAVRRVQVRKSSGATGTGRASGQRKRRGGKAVDRRRELFKRLVNAEAERQWLPVDLETAFQQAGEAVSRDYLRTLGRRMVVDGEIARHPSGNGFTSLSDRASKNGSGQETLKEAQT